MNKELDLLKKFGKSFYWAGRLLPKYYLKRCSELYSLCRKLDDIADDNSNLNSLKYLNENLNYLKSNNYKKLEENNIYIPSFLKNNKVAKKQIINLFNGLIFDQRLVRIKNEKELINYCYQVAGTVGVLMCIALECKNKKAYYFAVDLGIAMQLTNIARDLLEDAKLDRRYIPACFLDNLSEKILSVSNNKNNLENNKLKESLKKILDLSEYYYKSGNSGLVFLSPKIRISITIASNIYREIGNKLKKNGYKWYKGRIFTTKFEKIKLTVISLLKLKIGFRPQIPIHNRKLHVNLKKIL